MTVPIARKSEILLREVAKEALALADQFRAEGDRLERRNQSKSRGMLDVRVRDDSGIPRRGRHADNERARKLGFKPIDF